MSDLFYRKVSKTFIKKVFDVMNRASMHTFQVLTKRAERLAELSDELTWGKKHLDRGVENDKYKDRIDCLRYTEANVKFVSFEPLIGAVGKANLKNVDWVIVGGESGPKSRSDIWIQNGL